MADVMSIDQGSAAAACLSSVVVLSALFFYLRYYTGRAFFTVWGMAWLFYGISVAAGTHGEHSSTHPWVAEMGHWSLGTCAVCLFWGALRFLGVSAPHRYLVLFLAFIYSWVYACETDLTDPIWMRVALFGFAGAASLGVAAAIYFLHRQQKLHGALLLIAGFSLWGVHLASHGWGEPEEQWRSAGLFLSTVVPLLIGAGMSILILDEIRRQNLKMSEEIHTILSEKQALQSRMISVESKWRTLLAEVGVAGDTQEACQQIRQVQQAAVQEERLRALGQMASGIAHDVNNSLTPVIGFSDFLLETEPGLSEQAVKALGFIRTAAGSISQTVDRMRQFYRRRHPTEPLQVLQFNALTEQVIAELRAHEPKRFSQVQVDLQLHPEVPSVIGSEPELREALGELLQNALEAMPEGGTLTVITRKLEVQASSQDSPAENKVILEVCDSGIGMDEATRQRCLEPFFSTKGPRSAGLGLATVYGTARRHNAVLEVQSQPGQGTIVRLTFVAGELAAQPAATSVVRTQLLPLRILCIDDDERVSTMLQQVLSAQGHFVRVANSGAQGLEAFRQARTQGEAFQVVITDLGMPGIDGRKVLEVVKEEAPATPVIFLTARAAAFGPENSLPANLDGILHKPLAIARLQELLLRVKLDASPA